MEEEFKKRVERLKNNIMVCQIFLPDWTSSAFIDRTREGKGTPWGELFLLALEALVDE